MAGPGVHQKHQTNATHSLRSALILGPRESGGRVKRSMELRKFVRQDSIRVNTSPGACRSDWPKPSSIDRARTECPLLVLGVCRTPPVELSEVAGGLHGPRNCGKYVHKYLQRKALRRDAEPLLVGSGSPPVRSDCFPLTVPILLPSPMATFSPSGSS